MKIPENFADVWQTRMVCYHKRCFCRAWLVALTQNFIPCHPSNFINLTLNVRLPIAPPHGGREKAGDLLYRHFCGEGHNGLSDVKIQLIDRVNGEQQLREKEGQWAYKLNTLDPNGLNDNDFFFVQNRRSRRT